MRKISNSTKQTIVLGGGCFWCLEAVYQTVKGIEIRSGYAGGTVKNPTYKEVCQGTTGHAEVVEITYDSNVITLEKILEIFFLMHNPTTLNRQGNDIGTQYRSIILYSNEKEKQIIEQSIKVAQKNYKEPIVTEVTKLDSFYKAEEYHQNYYKRNPNQGYCRFLIQPKVQKMKKNILPKLEFNPIE